MKPRISKHDLKILSLYLDEQLSLAERKRLEERLRENQALFLTLEELRQTRLALRKMPRARVPRNFTLTPQMIRSRTVHRLLPAWGFVSAMASFLFILLLAGDLLGVFAQPSREVAFMQNANIEAAAPASENIQEKSPLAAPTEAFNLQADEAMKAVAPSETSSNALIPPAAAASLAEAATGLAVTPTPQPEGMAMRESPATQPGATAEVRSSGVVSDTQQTSLPTASPVEKSFSQSLESSPTPLETELEPLVTAVGNDQVTLMRTEQRQPASSSQVILWVLEGLFASVAVIAGLILFLQHRKIFNDRG